MNLYLRNFHKICADPSARPKLRLLAPRPLLDLRVPKLLAITIDKADTKQSINSGTGSNLPSNHRVNMVR